MRTTIRLPDDLIAKAKKLAADTHRTLTAVIEDALRGALARHHHSRRKTQPTRLITFRGTGLLPGVDLDDSAALLEVMESARAPDGR